MPSPFAAGRYHSLVIERRTLPRELAVTAWTAEGEIMGVRHRRLEVEGVQFHPGSECSPRDGKRLLGNWLARLAPPARARRSAVIQQAIVKLIDRGDLGRAEMAPR